MAEPKGLQNGGGASLRFAPDIDTAEALSRRALLRHLNGGTAYSTYENDMKRLQESMPPETWKELQRRSAVSMGNVDAVLNDKAQMAKYSQDAWSRAGLAGLRTLPRYVPLGYGMQDRAIGGSLLAAIERNVETDISERAFFSGEVAQKGYKDLAAIARHEGNHVVGARDNLDVEHMDSFYGHRPIAPPSFSMLGKILEKASPYAKKDSESLKYAGPRSLQTDRSITPEDIAKAKLTSQEYLQLIDAAHTLDEVSGNEIKRTLPGDTMWGDFIRTVQGVVGEGDITNAMKAWTEIPEQQRKWYRK